MKVCQECGTEVNEGVNFCPLCGNPIFTQVEQLAIKPVMDNNARLRQKSSAQPNQTEQSKDFTEKSLKELTQDIKYIGTNALKTLDYDTEGEEPSFTVANVQVKLSLIIKVFSVALCALFFFPFFNVNCSGIEVSFSGFDSTFGKTVNNIGRIEGNLTVIALLIIPIALFYVQHFKNKNMLIKGKLPSIFVEEKLHMFCMELSCVGFIGFVIFAVVVNMRLQDALVKAKYTFFYGLSICLYIAISSLSYLMYLASMKKRE